MTLKSHHLILVVVLGLFTAPGLSQVKGTTSSNGCCSLVADAIRDAGGIKQGMKRREVERAFRVGGGINYPPQTTYVYLRCSYISVTVKFELSSKGKGDYSPDDVVVSVSKPSLQYEATD